MAEHKVEIKDIKHHIELEAKKKLKDAKDAKNKRNNMRNNKLMAPRRAVGDVKGKKEVANDTSKVKDKSKDKKSKNNQEN